MKSLSNPKWYDKNGKLNTAYDAPTAPGQVLRSKSAATASEAGEVEWVPGNIMEDGGSLSGSATISHMTYYTLSGYSGNVTLTVNNTSYSYISEVVVTTPGTYTIGFDFPSGASKSIKGVDIVNNVITPPESGIIYRIIISNIGTEYSPFYAVEVMHL